MGIMLEIYRSTRSDSMVSGRESREYLTYCVLLLGCLYCIVSRYVCTSENWLMIELTLLPVVKWGFHGYGGYFGQSECRRQAGQRGETVCARIYCDKGNAQWLAVNPRA